mgnify:FL=1
MTPGNGAGPAEVPGPRGFEFEGPGLAPAGCAGFTPELLLAELPQSGCFLLLALDARLFIVLATPRLGQDSILLNALVEALESRLERFTIADDDFCQEGRSPRLRAHGIALFGAAGKLP